MSTDNENKWMKSVVNDSGKKIEESEAFISIFTPNFKENPRCALELGIAILLDKPIILMVAEDTWIPPSLRKLAHALIPIDMNNKESIELSQKKLQEVLKALSPQ